MGHRRNIDQEEHNQPETDQMSPLERARQEKLKAEVAIMQVAIELEIEIQKLGILPNQPIIPKIPEIFRFVQILSPGVSFFAISPTAWTASFKTKDKKLIVCGIGQVLPPDVIRDILRKAFKNIDWDLVKVSH